MAKAKFNRDKDHVNIGTIGHVDHGKIAVGIGEELLRDAADNKAGEGQRHIATVDQHRSVPCRLRRLRGP